MKSGPPLILFTLFALALAGCSKPAANNSATVPTNSVAPGGSFQERLAHITARNPNAVSHLNDPDAVLPGRHMSERQVIDLVSSKLPQSGDLRCEFNSGVWEVATVQRGAWGVASQITNVDGKVTIQSTNVTRTVMRVVMRVRDADGTVEPVTTP